jgi:hypothetical protein
MRRAVSLVLCLSTALNLPASASAAERTRPYALEPEPRPWGRGTLMPSLNLGSSLAIDRASGSLLLVGDLSYFFIDNLAAGVSLRNARTFFPSTLKEWYPGLEQQVATNELSVVPGMTFVIDRGYLVSPYIGLGAGPVFLNNGQGILGEVVAAPGVLISLRRQLAVRLAFDVAFRLPEARRDAAYRYSGPGGENIGFGGGLVNFGFQLGLVFGVGVGRKRHAPPTPPREPDRAPAPAADPFAEPQASSEPPATAQAVDPFAELMPIARTARPEPEPPTGRALVIGGTMLLGASVPLTLIGLRLSLAGAFSEGQDTPGAGFGLPLMAFGVVSLLAGIPVLSVGLVRRNTWRRWEHKHRVLLRPDLRHHAGSTSLGLVLRF